MRGKISAGLLIIIIGLAILIVASTAYITLKALEVREAGNEPFIIKSYLPIQNPNDTNETMTIDVVQNDLTRIAQKSWIHTDVTLYPNVEYRQANNLPLPIDSDEKFFLTFEGSICDLTRNTNIGYSCVYEMELSQDGKSYKLSKSPRYFSEGEYDLLLSNGKGSNATFTSTNADFIKILPYESHRDLNIQLLASYSGVLAVLIAVPSLILTVIFTRLSMLGISTNETKPKDAKPATEKHDQHENKE